MSDTKLVSKDYAEGYDDGLAVTKRMMEDIKDFHEKFGLIMPPSSSPCLLQGEELFDFRIKFMHEEFIEFVQAHQEGDLASSFDALIDLVYVAMGTAYLMGLPWQQGWDEVHKANMAKVRASEPSQSKRGTKYDVIKPDGWTPPDLQKVLDNYNAQRMAHIHESSTKD